MGYIGYNRLRRARNKQVQPFTFGRALHSARDRFTPRYAHRQDAAHVCEWFRQAGFSDIESVDWRRIPTSDQDDYRRNTGVRGTRTLASTSQAGA
jgi:hypothetical protein